MQRNCLEIIFNTATIAALYKCNGQSQTTGHDNRARTNDITVWGSAICSQQEIENCFLVRVTLQNITWERHFHLNAKRKEKVFYKAIYIPYAKKSNQWGLSRLAKHSVDFSYNWHRHFRRAWCFDTVTTYNKHQCETIRKKNLLVSCLSTSNIVN